MFCGDEVGDRSSFVPYTRGRHRALQEPRSHPWTTTGVTPKVNLTYKFDDDRT